MKGIEAVVYNINTWCVVPGCGTTSRIVEKINLNRNTVITSTMKAGNKLRKKLSKHNGNLVTTSTKYFSKMVVHSIL